MCLCQPVLNGPLDDDRAFGQLNQVIECRLTSELTFSIPYDRLPLCGGIPAAISIEIAEPNYEFLSFKVIHFPSTSYSGVFIADRRSCQSNCARLRNGDSKLLHANRLLS